jgi:serine phosphatase RsbU (regulator of sigma subunit)/CHASE3 domain sensor protein
MKRLRAVRIGQVVGLGFGLILFLAILIGLGGRIAYDVSKRQSNVIQTRGDVERLTLELEILASQRTDALRRYLETESATFLVGYRDAEIAFEEVFAQLAELLHTPEETQALQAIVAAETAFDNKAQEVFRLYDSGFGGSARFLWAREGIAVQDELLETIGTLRQIQNDISASMIQQARRTENLAIIVVTIFIGLVLLSGFATSLLITRSITKPLSHLVKMTTAIGADLSTRVNPSGPRETVFLGEAINQMAASLSNSRQSLQAYKDRLERELALASQIQASFLPTNLPRSPGLELAVFWKSAREIGGDFYAYIELENGQRAIAVGDVSGKGAPAAMAGALSVGLLEAYAPNYPKPESLLSELNNDLCVRFTENHMNVACCYAILDESASCLTVANAGCMYPYLRRGSSLHEIAARGLPLGAWPDFDYVSISLPLQPGDLLIFSSDGLVEAMNEQEELLGFDRLRAALLKLPPGIDAQAAVDQLVKVAFDFTGHSDLHDDMTILAVRLTDN